MFCQITEKIFEIYLNVKNHAEAEIKNKTIYSFYEYFFSCHHIYNNLELSQLIPKDSLWKENTFQKQNVNPELDNQVIIKTLFTFKQEIYKSIKILTLKVYQENFTVCIN